jgi:hypothetical protein
MGGSNVSNLSGRPTVSLDRSASGPTGIGGWLILPIIGFVGTIVLTGMNLSQALNETDGLVAIFRATSGPLVAIKVPTALSLVAGGLVIASGSYCLYLIFAKKHAIINFATAHYLILGSAGLIDIWTVATLQQAMPNTPSDPTVFSNAFRGIVIACIWIPYFRVSKRVRNTFKNPTA